MYVGSTVNGECRFVRLPGKRNKKTEDKNEVDDDDVIIDLNKNDYREKRDEE